MKNIYLIVLALIVPVSSFADSRTVVDGNILYRATALGGTDSDTTFKAIVAAVQPIAIECGFPHRDTVMTFKEVKANPGFQRPKKGNILDAYIAEVELQVPVTACEQARNTRDPSLKKKIINETLQRYMDAYEQSKGISRAREIAHQETQAEYDEADRRLQLADEALELQRKRNNHKAPKYPKKGSREDTQDCLRHFKKLLDTSNKLAAAGNEADAKKVYDAAYQLGCDK